MDKRKGFELTVELNVQAVTCPGVWLCPNGSTYLKICLLDSVVRTKEVSPVLPLLIHETFTFKKTFFNVYNLCELQDEMDNECIQAQLFQKVDEKSKFPLAVFQSSVTDLLFPSYIVKPKLKCVDVDLLMEPCAKFPGIIAPKIEVCTSTCICEVEHSEVEENEVKNTKLFATHKKSGFVCNPKFKRQKRVCHSKSIYSQEKYFQNQFCQDNQEITNKKGVGGKGSYFKLQQTKPLAYEQVMKTESKPHSSEIIQKKNTKSKSSFLQLNEKKDEPFLENEFVDQCTCCKNLISSMDKNIKSRGIFHDFLQTQDIPGYKSNYQEYKGIHNHKLCSICSNYNSVFSDSFKMADNLRKNSNRKTLKPQQSTEIIKENKNSETKSNNSYPSSDVYNSDIGKRDLICKCSDSSGTGSVKSHVNSELAVYRKLFYKHLENFYHQLYKHAKFQSQKS